MAQSHRVRIIGGKYKGKLLDILDAEGLRPTPDRVRETVFTHLAPLLEGAKVLDLFAGSGALGFEALSRGAASVTLIEKDDNNCANLQDEARTFVADRHKVQVLHADAISYLQQLPAGTVFDVVFLDPPYKSNLLRPALQLLLQRNLIGEHSVLYVEMSSMHSTVIPGFEIIREEQAGQVKFALWKKTSLLF